MKASARIRKITELLMPCNLLADIGCDHGYVSILAVKNKAAKHVVASDVAKGPLGKAGENISAEGLSERIDTVLSDGLTDIPGSPDALTICGMGGLLIKDILSRGTGKLCKVRQMILGPHSETEALRRYIVYETPFFIHSETVVPDDGKFYVLLDVRRKSCADMPTFPFLDDDLLFGRAEDQTDREAFSKMAVYMYGKYMKALNETSAGAGDAAASRRAELEHGLSVLKKIIDSTGDI